MILVLVIGALIVSASVVGAIQRILGIIFTNKFRFSAIFVLTFLLAGILWSFVNGGNNAVGDVGEQASSVSRFISLEKLEPGFEYLRVDEDTYTTISRRTDTPKNGIGDTVAVDSKEFSFCVNSAELIRTYNGKTPKEGSVYLAAEVTMTNNSNRTHGIYDRFHVRWGERYEEAGYWIFDGDAKMIEDIYANREGIYSNQMEDSYHLFSEESVTALAVFEVPLLEGTSEYNFSYVLGTFENENAFSVHLNLTTPDLADVPSSDDQAAEGYGGGIGDVITNGSLSYCINSAKLIKQEDYVEDDDIFLVADVTINNESNKDFYMTPGSFVLRWGYRHGSYSYPENRGIEEWTLYEGLSISTTFVYRVPVLEGKQGYRLECLDPDDYDKTLGASFDLTPPGPNDETLPNDWQARGYGAGFDRSDSDMFQITPSEENREEMQGNVEGEPTVEDVTNLFPQILFEYYDGYLAGVNWDDRSRFCNVTPAQQMRLEERMNNHGYYFDLTQVIIDMDTVEITEADDRYTIQFYTEFQFIPETRDERIRQEATGNVEIVDMVFYKDNGLCLVDNSRIVDDATIGANQLILRVE